MCIRDRVHITINKQPLEVPAGTRIIEAAKMLNIDIPHLCYHPDQTIKAHCRMCMVEVVGSRKLTAACSTVVWEGMEVITDSKKVYDAQTGVLDLILSDHKTNCLSCARNGSCELQALCRRFNRLHPELPDISSDEPLRIDNPSIVRDPAKCVKCGRCVKVCAEVQGCAALTYSGRSAGFKVTTAFDLPMDQTDCVLCGQCTPCREGNRHISLLLDKVAEGTHTAQDIATLKKFADIMSSASLCGLGETAQSALLSCMKRFPEVFAVKEEVAVR